MKVFRFSRIVVRLADVAARLCAVMIALAASHAGALEITLPPFEPPTFPPVVPIVRRYFGPVEELCASSSGAVTARKACRASEETIDPTGLTICARTTGAISLAGPKCPRGSTEVDLRAIRNTSPPTWFGAQSVPPEFEVLPPITPPIGPVLPGNPAPFPFPVTTAKELCQRGKRLNLREACLPKETTIHPSALVACKKRSGSVSIHAGACRKSDTRLDLRAVRGLVPNPIGIGPLVGLVPSLADLVAEYSN